MATKMDDINDIIKNTNENNQAKIDWTKAWSKKYPILRSYQQEVNIEKYAKEIRILLEQLKQNYGYSELDAVLVLKDILAHEMKKS